jgi:histidyl-tRNA synthetase
MNDVGSVQRLPGFRDFPPDDLAARTQVFDAWRRVSRRYGFQEYDGPPLEPLELYLRKSGEEIVDQLYNFSDKGEREVALRPEMTPSLARILAERSRALAKPIRWFSIPQLFRYERQQRGRLREHFQWNIDIVGEADVGADVEVVAVAIDGLRELGLSAEDFVARVSDRRLFEAIMSALEVPEAARPAVMGVVDKMEREGEERSERNLRETGLDAPLVHRLLTLFAQGGVDPVREDLGSRDEVGARLEDLDRYRADLGSLGLGDFRGLAYYTGIVFELFDRQGVLRAICGGGRYDRLLELVGGEPLPAVGFGMGDVVLSELLGERGLRASEAPDVDLYLVATAGEYRPLLLEIAARQRSEGRSVLYGLTSQSVRKQFKSAGSAGARQVLVLGPDEVARGAAVLKDMESGVETEVPLEDWR